MYSHDFLFIGKNRFQIFSVAHGFMKNEFLAEIKMLTLNGKYKISKDLAKHSIILQDAMACTDGQMPDELGVAKI